MAEVALTLEQKRAVALARVRRRRAEQEKREEVPAAPRDPLESYKQLDRNLLGGAIRGVGKIGSTILRPFETAEENVARRQAIEEFTRETLGAQPESGSYALGEFGAEFAGTAPIGGVLGRAARFIPGAARFAPALESGGFRTVGATAPARAVERVVGGAATGGAAAGLVDPANVGYGAAIGGAFPVVGPAVVNKLATGAGYFNDLVRGRLAEVNAAEIARSAAGADLPTIQAALGAAPGGLPSQTTADISTPAWQALLRIAEQQDPAGTAAALRGLQGREQLDALRRIAGGATQTEARAGREASKRALDQITTPMRETELAAAGEANRVLPGLEAKAERFRGAAAAKVEDVRRLAQPGGTIDRALEWAKNWKPSFMRGEGGPVPRYPAQYTYPGELAARGENVATRSAEESLLYGAAARDAEARAASLEAEGLRRLTSQPITDALRAKLANPEIGTNTQTNRAVTRIIDMLDEWTNQNGAITPEAIYAIRKNGVASVIEDMLPNATPKARRAFTAKVMTTVKPLLDDAIEQAGGTGWRNYLRTFEEGMHGIDQRKLAARAMTLYRKSPKKFIELVEGNDPEAIEKIFGPGSYDLVQEMGQGNANTLRRVADDMVREQTITGKIKEGVPAAQTIIERNQRSLEVRLPNFFSPKVTLTNKLLEGLEGEIEQKTMDALIKASQSGRNMNELLNTLPTSERNKLLVIMRNSKQWSPLLTPAGVAFADTIAR